MDLSFTPCNKLKHCLRSLATGTWSAPSLRGSGAESSPCNQEQLLLEIPSRGNGAKHQQLLVTECWECCSSPVPPPACHLQQVPRGDAWAQQPARLSTAVHRPHVEASPGVTRGEGWQSPPATLTHAHACLFARELLSRDNPAVFRKETIRKAWQKGFFSKLLFTKYANP